MAGGAGRPLGPIPPGALIHVPVPRERRLGANECVPFPSGPGTHSGVGHLRPGQRDKRAAAAIAVAALALPACHQSTPFLCAGVGLSGPTERSPERAVAAFVKTFGGQPKEWKRDRTMGSTVIFMGPRSTFTHGSSNLSVRRQRPGSWAVDGTC